MRKEDCGFYSRRKKKKAQYTLYFPIYIQQIYRQIDMT